MRYTWLTQGGFLFDSAGTRLVVDPYMSDFLEKNHHMTRLAPFPLTLESLRPDWLFCTHDHLDHLDPQTVEAISQAYPACRFVGPQSCCDHFGKLGIDPDRCLLATCDEPLQCGPFAVRPVPAIHSDPDAIGLVIEVDGRRIYLSGDSEYDPKLVHDHTRDADTVFICINGRWGNMNDVDALRIVEAIRPTTAVPMHYGLFAENTADPQAFLNGCEKLGIRSFAMEPGEEYEL